MPKNICLLAADDRRAKLYVTNAALEQLTIIYDQVNFVGGQHPPAQEQNLLPGQADDAVAGSAEDEAFARSLSKVLQAKLQAGRFTALVLLAPPPFLATLRRHLGKDCLAVLLGSIASDSCPTRLSAKDLLGIFRDWTKRQHQNAVLGASD
jgi:protein required for attachment to host cells